VLPRWIRDLTFFVLGMFVMAFFFLVLVLFAEELLDALDDLFEGFLGFLNERGRKTWAR
jgi:hypothetical protein